jgi:hypothetical protein
VFGDKTVALKSTQDTRQRRSHEIPRLGPAFSRNVYRCVVSGSFRFRVV